MEYIRAFLRALRVFTVPLLLTTQLLAGVVLVITIVLVLGLGNHASVLTDVLRRHVDHALRAPMRLKSLNGAPLCKNLDFGSSSLLGPDQEDRAFTAFLDENPAWDPANETSSEAVKWRHLDPRPGALRSGWSQPNIPKGGLGKNAEKIELPSYIEPDPDSQNNLPDESTLLDSTLLSEQESEFLEQSWIFHDNLVSSQIALDDSDVNADVTDKSFFNTSLLTDSFATDVTDATNGESQLLPTLQLPESLTIMPLANLPNARHLRSIYPQTPTPTFLCVLLNPVEQKEVLVKKGRYKMELYEITVADDTKSGFKVTFWFRPHNPASRFRNLAHEKLRSTLDNLQVGDILLLRNIVLSIFRNEIYGQSLNANINKARTSVEVLVKGDGTSLFKHIVPVSADEKFTTVKRWAKVHIAAKPDSRRKRKSSQASQISATKRKLRSYKQSDEGLPPDTLESV